MKILKTAKQKNVTIDSNFLTRQEIYYLLNTHKIFFWHDYEPCYKFDLKEDDEPLHIFTNDLDEVKVIYDREYQMYKTIAVCNDGSILTLNIL